jgi:hypothetical protein
MVGSDILRRQDFFRECGAGAGVVVLGGDEDRDRFQRHSLRRILVSEIADRVRRQRMVVGDYDPER